MRRRMLLAGTLGLTLLGTAAAWAQDDKAYEMKLQHQMRALPEIRAAIQSATGYDENSILLTPGHHQLFVRIMQPARRNGSRDEASVISSAIAKTIAGKPEFSDVDVLHIDYVGDGGDTHTYDFRKDPQGTFRQHVS